MSTCKTENYQLHAWGAEDEESLAEINENFAKLDGAAQVVVGSYSGDEQDYQDIMLGFQPKALLVADKLGFLNTTAGGFFTPVNESQHAALRFTEQGFRVYADYGGFATNRQGNSPYIYLALR